MRKGLPGFILIVALTALAVGSYFGWQQWQHEALRETDIGEILQWSLIPGLAGAIIGVIPGLMFGTVYYMIVRELAGKK
jgi:ABC-type Fe3+ transport system permease subunit